MLQSHLLSECQKRRELFDSIFNVDLHNALVARGERRFSHKALQVCYTRVNIDPAYIFTLNPYHMCMEIGGYYDHFLPGRAPLQSAPSAVEPSDGH